MVSSSNIAIRKIATRASLCSSPRSVYVCVRCRRLASNAAPKGNPSFPVSQTKRRSASSSSFTDKLRKRIWGTDAPPGEEDPYGAPGFIEQRRRAKEAKEQEESNPETKTLPPQRTADDPNEDELEDIPESDATTWEGMPVVGGPDWGMEEWDEQHPFEGFVYIVGFRIGTNSL